MARETGRLQLTHRDPADRFLLATAKVFELTLVTADERLMKIREVPVLANRESQPAVEKLRSGSRRSSLG